MVAWSFSPNAIDISLVSSGDPRWVAFGFAPQASMANSDLYYCFNNGAATNNEKNGVYSAFAPQNSTLVLHKIQCRDTLTTKCCSSLNYITQT